MKRSREYTVTVSVSDSNGGTDSINVTINVTDANEAPTFTEGDSTTRSVAEHTDSGTNTSVMPSLPPMQITTRSPIRSVARMQTRLGSSARPGKYKQKQHSIMKQRLPTR